MNNIQVLMRSLLLIGIERKGINATHNNNVLTTEIYKALGIALISGEQSPSKKLIYNAPLSLLNITVNHGSAKNK